MSQARESLGSGRHLELVARDGWEFVTRLGSTGVVAVVALTGAEEIILVEQFRVPIGEPTLELPAGLVGDEVGAVSEGALTAGQRELAEETGFAGGEWRRLGECVSSGGLTDEAVVFFSASGVERVGPGGGVAGERIRVIAVPLANIDAWLAARMSEKAAIDAKVYAGIALLRHRRAGTA